MTSSEKPVSIFPDHALFNFAHDPIGKPVSTFPDHAVACPAQITAGADRMQGSPTG
jgi:hypothetical protein